MIFPSMSLTDANKNNEEQQQKKIWKENVAITSMTGGGQGNPLQYSCLENPMDRAAWRATAHGVAKSQTGLSD